MNESNTQVLLASRPEGLPKSSDFEMVERPVREPEEGEVTVIYPSTCEYCDARIEGLDAVFRFDSATLEIRYPSFGMPRQLIDAYRAMAKELAKVEVVKDLLPLG